MHANDVGARRMPYFANLAAKTPEDTPSETKSISLGLKVVKA